MNWLQVKTIFFSLKFVSWWMFKVKLNCLSEMKENLLWTSFGIGCVFESLFYCSNAQLCHYSLQSVILTGRHETGSVFFLSAFYDPIITNFTIGFGKEKKKFVLRVWCNNKSWNAIFSSWNFVKIMWINRKITAH